MLSEHHAKRLEVQLTQFIVDEMQREGSSHYRPEAAQATSAGNESAEKHASGGNVQPKKKNKKQEDGQEETQPKKKPKKTKKDEEEEARGEENEGEETGENKSPLPW